MKISYLCYWDLRAGDGVADKIECADLALASGRPRGRSLRAHREPGRRGGGAAHADVSPSRACSRACGRRAASHVRFARSRPDLVYLRYDVFLPTLAPPRSPLETRRRAELERRRELQARSQAVATVRASATATASGSSRRRRGRHDGARTRVETRPAELATVTIANGIELGPVRDPTTNGGEPGLVYIGEDVYWQGIDKLYRARRGAPVVELRSDRRCQAPHCARRTSPATASWRSPTMRTAPRRRRCRARHARAASQADGRGIPAQGPPLPRVRPAADPRLPPTPTSPAVDPWWLYAAEHRDERRDSLSEIESFVESVTRPAGPARRGRAARSRPRRRRPAPGVLRDGRLTPWLAFRRCRSDDDV